MDKKDNPEEIATAIEPPRNDTASVGKPLEVKEPGQAFPKLWPITIMVRQVSLDRWYAEINQGWWVASSTTRQGAIDAVKKRYQQEQEKFYA